MASAELGSRSFPLCQPILATGLRGPGGEGVEKEEEEEGGEEEERRSRVYCAHLGSSHGSQFEGSQGQ